MRNATKVLTPGQDVRLRCPRCGNHLVQVQHGTSASMRCPACAPLAPAEEPAKAKAAPKVVPAATRPQRAAVEKSKGNRGWKLTVLGLEALVIAAVVTHFISGRSEDAPPPPAPLEVAKVTPAVTAPPVDEKAAVPKPPSPVEFQTGASGMLSVIVAPDARSALIRFCEHPSNQGKLTPIALSPTIPVQAHERFGLIRDSDDVATLKYVRIRRDNVTHRWVIGVPWKPIEVQKAPMLPPGTQTVPI